MRSILVAVLCIACSGAAATPPPPTSLTPADHASLRVAVAESSAATERVSSLEAQLRLAQLAQAEANRRRDGVVTDLKKRYSLKDNDEIGADGKIVRKP